MGGSAGRLLVVGGSAGALAPLLRIVEGLRTDLDLGLIVCLHRPAGHHLEVCAGRFVVNPGPQ